MIPAHPGSGLVGTRRRLYTRAARDGFEALLGHLTSPGGRSVLLPAYIGWSPREGSGLFDPIESTRTPYAFYPLDEHLRMRRDTLREMIDAREPAAVVLVHWFGVPEPGTVWLAEVCRERGVALIEDCAHGLGVEVDGRPAGEVGHYTLASLHKVLACGAGGYLQANGDATLPAGQGGYAAIDAGDLALFASADLVEIARRRRANYASLLRRISPIVGVRPFFGDALPDGAVPLNLPVIVETADRDVVYERMRALGIGVVTLYHTLVDALRPSEFPESFRLSERIFNLPIHHELGEDDVERVAEALDEVIRDAPERNRAGRR